MNKIISACLFFLFTWMLFITPVAGEEVSCDQLILKRCELCHYNTRICQKIGKKSKGQWRRTIKTMVSYGADLTKEEQSRLLLCLNGPSAEIKTLCEVK